MATRKAELYDEDFYAWSREQAARCGGCRPSAGTARCDLEHLAEEVEDLGDQAPQTP